jgi:hypothetical protein
MESALREWEERYRILAEFAARIFWSGPDDVICTSALPARRYRAIPPRGSYESADMFLSIVHRKTGRNGKSIRGR